MSEFLIEMQTKIGIPSLFFDSWSPIIRILFTTIITFVFLIISLRLFGNRSVSSMSIHDVITSFTIGSTVSSTLVLKEVTLLNGFVAIVVLLLLQYIISKLISKWPLLARFTNPSPEVLFLEGEFLEEAMNKTRVTKEEIYSTIRIQARCSSDKVFAVLLESNGELSVLTDVSPSYEKEITKYLN